MGVLPAETTLEAFVEADFLGNSDAMVRQLVADPSLDTKQVPAFRHGVREVTQKDYDEAISAIENRFIFAAPTTHYDPAIVYLALKKRWSLGDLFVPSQNITASNEPLLDVDDSVRERILSVNRWDARLYETCQQNFKRKLSELSNDEKKLIDVMVPLLSVYRKLCSEEGDNRETTKWFGKTSRQVEKKHAERI